MSQSRNNRKWWQLGILSILGISGASTNFSDRALAQSITLDGSLGSAETLTGPEYTIPQAVGQTVGTNLFHSFGQFGLEAGETAIFESATEIGNIFSRVTGGSPSFIDGLISTQSSNVNLFLLNPSGVIFGPNAELDIGGTTRGSFVTTTLDALVWNNGGQFSATNPSDSSSLLTLVGDPSGFLGSLRVPGAIISERSQSSVSNLAVAPTQSLLLLGGDINLAGTNLNAPGGRVEISGLNGAGTVALNNDGSLSIPDSVALSNVSLSDGVRVNVAADGSGSIAINAQNLDISAGSLLRGGIEPNSTFATQAGDIEINATDSVTISNSSILNNLRAGSVGNSGGIFISTGSLVSEGSQIESSTFGQGNAGSIFVRASESALLDNTYIFSNIEPGGVGLGGEINITSRSLSLIDGSQLQALIRSASNTLPGGNGQAGNVNISVRDNFTIAGISDITGLGSAIFGSVGRDAVGNAGNVTVTANSVSLSDGTQISSSSFGQGDAGTISIQATEAVTLDNGYIYNNIESQAEGTGGEINILAGSLSLTNGARLETLTRGKGDAGNVFLQTNDSISLSDSQIFSDVEQGAVGNAGNVTITAKSVSLTDGAEIITDTSGEGDGGLITIQALETVSLSGEDTAIFSDVNGTGIGNALGIIIAANSVSLTDGAQVSSSSYGQGNAGIISIQANQAVTLDNSDIFSDIESQAEGTGGEINILAGSLSLINGSQLVTSIHGSTDTSPGGRGQAGDVNVTVRDAVTISGTNAEDFPSAIFSDVEQGAIGNAGNVTITANSVSLTDGAQIITDTSGEGDGGLITIQALETVSLSGEDTDIFSDVNETGIGNALGVIITANSVFLTDGAQVSSSSYGQGNSGIVYIQANQAVTLDSSNIFSNIESQAEGTGGEINVFAGSLSLTNGARLETLTRGQGDAGNLFLQVNTSISLSDGAILQTFTNGRGDAGDVFLQANDSIFLSDSRIFTSVEPEAVGKGGDITIVTGSLALANGSQANASTRGRGDAGTVFIRASDITLSGINNNNLASGVFSSLRDVTSEGNGGTILIQADSLNLKDGAQLQTLTRGRGGAGLISINANNISVSGVNPNTQSRSGIYSTVELGAESRPVFNNDTIASGIVIDTDSLSVRDGAQISVDTRGNGGAGEVVVTASGDVFVTGKGSAISSNVGQTGRGAGGGVGIFANSVFVNDGAQLSSSTFGIGNAGGVVIQADDSVSLANGNIFTNVRPGAEGAGGSVVIDTNLLSLTEGAVVSANTSGRGNAGNVTVLAKDSITLTDRGSSINTSVTPTAQGTGGSIDLRSPTISVTNNAGVSVASLGQGNGGNLSIQSQQITLDDGGSLTATTANGEGGNINISAQDLVLLRRNSNISATAGNNANGGNINIDTKFIIAPGKENSDITANAVEGQGGEIDITAEGIFGIQSRSEQTPFSDITASSELGIDGTVELNTPDVDPSQGLVALPAETVDDSNQIAAGCTNSGNSVASNRFTVTGRGGLPPNPGDALGGDAVLTNWATLGETEGENISRRATTTSSRKNLPTQPIVEAQGWIVDANGKVFLTAQAPNVTANHNKLNTTSCNGS